MMDREQAARDACAWADETRPPERMTPLGAIPIIVAASMALWVLVLLLFEVIP